MRCAFQQRGNKPGVQGVSRAIGRQAAEDLLAKAYAKK